MLQKSEKSCLVDFQDLLKFQSIQCTLAISFKQSFYLVSSEPFVKLVHTFSFLGGMYHYHNSSLFKH